MPDIPPLITSRPNNQSLYAPVTPLPTGLASNITWGADPFGTSTLVGQIPVANLLSSGTVQCTLQSGLVASTNINDCINNWLVDAAAANGNIRVYINGNSPPSDNTHFGVSWAVTRLA